MAEVGIIGLGVMGAGLVQNLLGKGFSIAVYNRTWEKTENLVKEAGGRPLTGTSSLEELCKETAHPRKILLMVQAGEVTDEILKTLVVWLESGDVVLDGGNARVTDTDRRAARMAQRGIHYLGCGISGGEEGARNGPAIMVGGDWDGWLLAKHILKAAAARIGDEVCCEWLGPGGAGHFIKTVHNGIEYAEMQLLAETFSLLRRRGLSTEECGKVFSDWNAEAHTSFLVEIAARVLCFEEGCLVERISDVARQKGTGAWCAIDGLNTGIPVSMMAEAVFWRFLSAMKPLRENLAQRIERHVEEVEDETTLKAIGSALLGARYLAYTQGFMLIRRVFAERGWKADFAAVTTIWGNGCILRGKITQHVKKIFEEAPELECLLLDTAVGQIVECALPAWRKIVSEGALAGVPLPVFGAGLAFVDGCTKSGLSTNLLQALRDCFGAHGYELEGKEGVWSTKWTTK